MDFFLKLFLDNWFLYLFTDFIDYLPIFAGILVFI